MYVAAIRHSNNLHFTYDNDPDEDITNYDDIINFKCNAEKSTNFYVLKNIIKSNRYLFRYKFVRNYRT